MTLESQVEAHYAQSTLGERLLEALRLAGKDVDRLTVADLAPIDHFHGRGLEATEQLAARLPIRPGDHLLDIGSGIGGPARWYAERFGCRVTGIDLTAEFCAAATLLTEKVGLADRVSFRQGSAVDLPFADGAFDGAISLNVLMNIEDKPRFFREAFRVLRPGGFLATTEAVSGPGGAPLFPAPWATRAETSFLASAEESRRHAEAAGFVVESVTDTTDAAIDFADRARRRLREHGPPALGTHLVMGAEAVDKARNASRNVAERRTIPIETILRRP